MIRQFIPNFLSALRVASVPLMVWSLTPPTSALVGPLLAFCLGTDLLDGYLARRWQVQSKLGAVLDTAADLGGISCFAAAMFTVYRPVLEANGAAFTTLAALYLTAHAGALSVRRTPASFSGSLGRPAMASLALFAGALAVKFTPAWVVLSVCSIGSAAAVQEIVRVTRRSLSGREAVEVRA